MLGDAGVDFNPFADSLPDVGMGTDISAQNKPPNSYDIQMKCEGGRLQFFITGERSFQVSFRLWQSIY